MFGRCLSLVCLLLVINSASAQEIDKSKLPPMQIYEAMLDANRPTGWVQFRNYDGRQLVYFTALQTMHCRLKEIRYSINSEALDQQFGLVKCNPQLPFSLPDGAGPETVLVSLEAGTAKTVAVQVIWDDGRKSDIAIYEPCRDVGEQTCAQLLN